MSERVILDLCGGTGAWSEPYRDAGYDVRVVTLPDQDVRAYEPPAGPVYGVLAAPPCTEFAASGARWWAAKEPGLLAEGLEVVAACLRIIERVRPWFWALENPVGRLRRFIGPQRYSFQWEYGDPWLKRTCMWGNHNEPPRLASAVRPEGPTERTSFKLLGRADNKALLSSARWRLSLTNHLSDPPTAAQIGRLVETGMLAPDWIHKLGPSPERATLRSITPPGFARAFFEANA